MNHDIGFVLIHGAGLGRWIWNDTIGYLKHDCLAVDFPGRTETTNANNALNLEAYCDHILAQIRQWDKPRIVIVAHSIGGVIALKIAHHLGEQVVGFVGLSASIPKNGQSFLSTLPFPKQVLMKIILRLAGTKPPKSAIMASLCHDLSAEQAASVAGQFMPESVRLYFDASNAPIPKTRKLYIKSRLDLEFSETLQDEMAQNLNADESATLEAGHLAMISQPKQLADILHRFVSEH